VPLDMKPIDGVEPAVYNKMLQVLSQHCYKHVTCMILFRSRFSASHFVAVALPCVFIVQIS
jgi:hypothetical protein